MAFNLVTNIGDMHVGPPVNVGYMTVPRGNVLIARTNDYTVPQLGIWDYDQLGNDTPQLAIGHLGGGAAAYYHHKFKRNGWYELGTPGAGIEHKNWNLGLRSNGGDPSYSGNIQYGIIYLTDVAAKAPTTSWTYGLGSAFRFMPTCSRSLCGDIS